MCVFQSEGIDSNSTPISKFRILPVGNRVRTSQSFLSQILAFNTQKCFESVGKRGMVSDILSLWGKNPEFKSGFLETL